MTAAIRVFICTWNVAEAPPPDENALKSLLHVDQEPFPDLYAIGLQEQKSGWTQLSDIFFDDPWNAAITNFLNTRNYVRLTNVRILGINLIVLAKRKWMPHITDVETNYTRVGFHGFWGNKGGVSVSLNICGINVVLVNCHLAAHMQHFKSRIQQYNTIQEYQRFSKKDASTILDHDYVFWFGDLNFRVDNMSISDIKEHIKNKEYQPLLEKDQLKKAMADGMILLDFHEGAIEFDPTYKFDRGTNTYDTSAKKRKPAWCDRILWSVHKDSFEGVNLDVKQTLYTSYAESTISDHKAVTASFEAQVLKDLPKPAVLFDTVTDFIQSRNGQFSFSISKDMPVSNWDWIGLFRMDYKHMWDYTGYVWKGTPGEIETKNADGSRSVTSFFHHSYLEDLNGHYCMAYISSYTKSFKGVSQSFRIRRNDTSTEERSSSVDRDEL